MIFWYDINNWNDPIKERELKALFHPGFRSLSVFDQIVRGLQNKDKGPSFTISESIDTTHNICSEKNWERWDTIFHQTPNKQSIRGKKKAWETNFKLTMIHHYSGPLCIATYQKLEVTAMEVIMRGLLNPADIRTVEEGALAKAEKEALIFQTNVEFLVAISRRGVYQEQEHL